MGYSHIPQRFAPLVNAFCRDHLNPYVNFHRPCLFAETITDAKGRQRKRYPYELMMTPYEKLQSLPKAEQFLKPGITFPQLDAQATAMSDNDAAQHLNDARAILFKTIFNRSKNSRLTTLKHRPSCRRAGKTGEGKVSTEAMASILEPPGELICSETAVGGVAPRLSAFPLQSASHGAE